MKTIQEILKAKGITETTQHHNYEYLYKSIIICAEEYANQFKYDYSQNCKCGDDSTGSTWCCNICGLPTLTKI